LDRTVSVTLVLGGARSGKSDVAEGLMPDTCTYVATGIATDTDMAARIEAHRARRSSDWVTVETSDVASALRTRPDDTVLVDALGTWVARHDGLDPDIDDLIAALRSHGGHVVLVSDEVGMGVHPETEVGRRFRDVLGELNRRVAEVADRVVLVVAGRTLDL
jgi:adenosyl cobinamide kinase/adenosyl cobinamide phosphate guanylyltransferase